MKYVEPEKLVKKVNALLVCILVLSFVFIYERLL